MQGLMLHCGANRVEIDQLAAMPRPKSLGPRHQPLPHIEYIDMLKNALRYADLQIREEAYGMTEDGNKFFGLMAVNYMGDSTYDTIVGLRGSHDQSISRGLSIGNRVFVCDNLAFSGDFVLKTKHTTNIRKRIFGLMYDALEKMKMAAASQAGDFDNFKNAEISDTRADAAILNMFRNKVITQHELPKVLKEWDHPSHPEFDQPTVWRLFNAATEAMKPADGAPSKVFTLTSRSMKLHDMCNALTDSEQPSAMSYGLTYAS